MNFVFISLKILKAGDRLAKKNKLSIFLEEITSNKKLIFGDRASHLLGTHLKDLKKRNLFGSKIAVPALLCHAPIAAIIDAGWEPYFLEIDKTSGQVKEAAIKEAMENHVSCFLWVHMYGNPHESEIYSELCHNQDFYIIEDCCLSLGAKFQSGWTGSKGDTSLFSFGETKPFNVGGGGCLALKNEFSDFETHPYEKSDGTSFREKFYEHMIQYKQTGNSSYLTGLIDDYIPFLGEVSISGDLNKFNKANYFDEVKRRREKNLLYTKFLGDSISPVKSDERSVPWRFIFRIDGISGKKQYELSERMRADGIHVSNWYLPAHFMTKEKCEGTSTLNNTEEFSNEVFQLWLDESHDDEKIEKNCQKILKIIKEIH